MTAYRKTTSATISATIAITALLVTLLTFGCPSDEPVEPPKKDSTLAGTIELPPGKRLEGASIAAMQNGKEMASASVDPATGKYLITLPGPGTYDLRIKTSMGVLDFASGINVAEGQQANAQPFPAPADLFDETPPAPGPDPTPPVTIDIKPPHTDPEHSAKATAKVSGKVHPAEAEIKIISEGKIIARGKAAGGAFEVTSIPPGLYDVEYSAKGYTTVFQENVAVSDEGALQKLTGFLLYISPLDGVDWDTGTVTATGLGKAPPNMTPPQAALMACRGAKVIAYRNLLDTILNVQVDPGKTIASMDGEGTFKSQLQGFVQGARVIKETKNSDGSCEVTLQAPLKGKNSVTSFVQSKTGY